MSHGSGSVHDTLMDVDDSTIAVTTGGLDGTKIQQKSKLRSRYNSGIKYQVTVYSY